MIHRDLPKAHQFLENECCWVCRITNLIRHLKWMLYNISSKHKDVISRNLAKCTVICSSVAQEYKESFIFILLELINSRASMSYKIGREPKFNIIKIC